MYIEWRFLVASRVYSIMLKIMLSCIVAYVAPLFFITKARSRVCFGLEVEPAHTWKFFSTEVVFWRWTEAVRFELKLNRIEYWDRCELELLVGDSVYEYMIFLGFNAQTRAVTLMMQIPLYRLISILTRKKSGFCFSFNVVSKLAGIVPQRVRWVSRRRTRLICRWSPSNSPMIMTIAPRWAPMLEF
jgi:hypothetical protein